MAEVNILNREIKIAVIGGDERQLITAHELSDVGFEVAVYGFGSYIFERSNITRCVDLEGAVRNSAAVVLPIPLSKDNRHLYCPLGTEDQQNKLFEDLFTLINPSQLVIGGGIGESFISAADHHGIKLFDCLKRDEVAILNAVPTAEGALEIAFHELPVTLYGSKVHVLGFGRIGKVLAKSSNSLGADVTVHSRNASDMAWTKIFGYQSSDIRQLGSNPRPFEDAAVVFNTVPKIIVTAPVLKKMSKKTLIIDVASLPGGVDKAAAEKEGIKIIHALALPGKTAPVSSGKIISDGIFGILQEKGITP